MAGLTSGASEVKRSIPLLPVAAAQMEAAAARLRAIEPISELHFDGTARLRLRYDASCVGFGEIERLLDEAGLVRADSAWWRFKAAWYRFLDRNARSNALSRGGACCNRPPSAWNPGRDAGDER